jgi:hypothetical protein
MILGTMSAIPIVILNGLPTGRSQTEDFLRIPEHNTTAVGEGQLPSLLDKERMSESLFELMNLFAHRRLRQPQFHACPGKAFLARYEPEIQKMVIIDPLHTRSYYFDLDEEYIPFYLFVEVSPAPYDVY